MPPVLGVLTHIDLLSPSLEWSPPYDWQQPQRVKERSIHDAVAATGEQLQALVAGVVPVCTAAGKVYGVTEWLLPALMELLDQAHAVALLRCLRAEANAGKLRRVFHQLAAAGKTLVRTLWRMNLPQSRARLDDNGVTAGDMR
jgi:predicted GTPase